MSEPISTVVKVAANPEQAKIYIAMLQAEGIPAFTDAQSAPDEFAMTQKMMNLSSVKVFVPTEALERAREILQPTDIDPAELERQALEAADDADGDGDGDGGGGD